jgi:hypothetical protein
MTSAALFLLLFFQRSVNKADNTYLSFLVFFPKPILIALPNF